MTTPEARTLRSGFLGSAATRPDAVALTVGGRELSYGEIEDRARRWATALLDRLDAPPRRVGVFGHRSETGYVAVLASLFAGATFVPLNRSFPVARTRSMIERADLDVLIADAASAPQLPELLAGMSPSPLVVLPDAATSPPGLSPSTVTAEHLDARAPLADLPEVDVDDIAYLLFTSGSTGEPKGVPITHGNVRHFLDTRAERYRLGPDDRLSQTFDQTFDLSVFDLFMAWDAGARACCLQSLELLTAPRSIERLGLTVWFSVPSLVPLLQRKGLLVPESLPSLRWSLFCGEPLPSSAAEAWQAAAPESIVENLYGPTELTISCTVHRWDATRSPAACLNGLVPIGTAHEGLTCLLVDESLRETTDGEPGELCVAGPQTFPGYWQRSDLDETRLFEHEVKGRRLRFYRTGDRVRREASGELVFLGRADHQVKVHGHRVELGEVEHVLRELPGVVEAVALAWPHEHGSATGIAAWLTGTVTDMGMVQESARDRLPDYMVPRVVRHVDELPLNANGKIDRRELERRLDVEPAS
ncbi:MAG: amino acid adenylation domain-containing protein [Acidobacteriota bacterium]